MLDDFSAGSRNKMKTKITLLFKFSAYHQTELSTTTKLTKQNGDTKDKQFSLWYTS